MENQNSNPKGIPQDYDDKQQQENAVKSYADTAENKKIVKEENDGASIEKRKDATENAISPEVRSGHHGL